jgi:hypothetical protein
VAISLLLNPSAMSIATSRSRLPSGSGVLAVGGPASRTTHGTLPVEARPRFKCLVEAGLAEHGSGLLSSLRDQGHRERARLGPDGSTQHLRGTQELCRTLRASRHRGGTCERFHSHRQSGPVVNDQGGIQRFDQRRLGRSVIAEHQGTHACAG